MRIRKTNHTSFTVSSLARALDFWHGALGFEIVRRGDFAGGAFIDALTGIPGAEIAVVKLQAPGHVVELIEYRSPAGRGKIEPRLCDVGATHIAFEVDDLDGLLATIAPLGWESHGPPQQVPGKRHRVVYVRGPDGIVVELEELTTP